MSAFAKQLRRQLDEPIYNAILKRPVGTGDLDYERYLRTPELLTLQTSRDELVAPEELMFQVVHQTQELWLKLVAHEGAAVVEALDADALWQASEALSRSCRIFTSLHASMQVLETLTPDAYQVIRRSLGNGSGQESPGFNAVRLVGEALAAALDRLLERRHLPIAEAYAPGNDDVKRICEQLVDFDEGYQNWLVLHYQLVRRTIGVGKQIRALDGVSTQVLVGRMTQPLLPRLWELRGELTASWDRAGGHAPGAQRRSEAS
ncbi:tryptophan 2,3-dioxygenase family protein [Vulgatibacter sp.]|uniref:tryptophan 2,3-dioxygenase family protein n=1 Tax=Vulgatibacter sp. TaxID=1971226 RepID=UPI003562287B